MAYANGSVTLASKSCEQMQSDMARGENPFDRSLTFSKFYSWRDQMGKSQTGNDSVDVLQAMNIVDSRGGDGGVPWVGGQNAGGRDQPPILVVSDVVKAGYNIEQGRDPTGNDQGQPDTRVAQVWKTPAEAVDYACAMLGDVKIETKNNADREAQPGHMQCGGMRVSAPPINPGCTGLAGVGNIDNHFTTVKCGAGFIFPYFDDWLNTVGNWLAAYSSFSSNDKNWRSGCSLAQKRWM